MSAFAGRTVKLDLNSAGEVTALGIEGSLGDWLRRLFPPPSTPSPPIDPIVVVGFRRDDDRIGKVELDPSSFTKQSLIDAVSHQGTVDRVEFLVDRHHVPSLEQLSAGVLAADSLGIEAQLLLTE